MSLISLPKELLFQIAALLLDGPKSECLNCYRPNRCDCHALAATCRITRSVAVSILYKYVRLDPCRSWVFNLHQILTLDPEVASCVRHFTLAFPERDDLPGWSGPEYTLQRYREIVRSCPDVKTLLITTHYPNMRLCRPPLDAVTEYNEPYPTNYGTQPWGRFGNLSNILVHISPHSQKTIRHIEFKSLFTRQLWLLLQHLTDFTALKTLLVADCRIDEEITGSGWECSDPWKIADLLNRKPPLLLSVETFSISTRVMESEVLLEFYEALDQELNIGYFIASSMPNIRTFNIDADSDIIYGALTRYADIGRNLTCLNLYPQNSVRVNTHLCDIISTLSQRLTHLNISEAGEPLLFCHKLFAGKWTNLKKLTLDDCKFPYGCDGNNLDQLRINLLHLLDSNLAAEVELLGGCYWKNESYVYATIEKLVWKKPGQKEYLILEQMFDEPDEADFDTESVLDEIFSVGEEESDADSDMGGVEVAMVVIESDGGPAHQEPNVDDFWKCPEEEAGGKESDSDDDLGGVYLHEGARYEEEEAKHWNCPAWASLRPTFNAFDREESQIGK